MIQSLTASNTHIGVFPRVDTFGLPLGGDGPVDLTGGERESCSHVCRVCGAQLLLFAWEVSYYERLLIDVVQIQRKDVIFAAHVHAIVVLVHAEDPIVGGVQQKGEVVSRASGL